MNNRIIEKYKSMSPEARESYIPADYDDRYRHTFTETESIEFFSVYDIMPRVEQEARLQLAANRGKIEQVRRLLDLGVNIDAKLSMPGSLYPKSCALEAAIMGDHDNVIQLLLERGVNLHHTFGNQLRFPHLTREVSIRAVLLLQRHLEYARMPKELFGVLLTYLL